MPFGTTEDTYGKLLRNKSTTQGAEGVSSGFTRGGTRQRGTSRDVTNPNAAAGTVGGGAWGGGERAVGTPAPKPYDPAAAASATAASGAAAREAAGQAPTGKPPQPYGSESGNTYLEDRYLQRLFGNDPAFNYAAKRGGDALDTRMSAGGSFNSGARGQQQSDMYANLLAQSQGQLDALAAGATGARQNKLNSMFGSGLGLAGGQAGTGGAYDLKGADSGNAMLQAILMMMLNKAGVDSKSNSAGFANIGALGSLFG